MTFITILTFFPYNVLKTIKAMQIKNLADLSFDEIVDCFLKSFADYAMSMDLPASFWKKRWATDQVDFSLSFGMFDDGQLVGFILNGIGVHEQKKTAFNAGTGVLPSHRGQRIVKQLYANCLPILREKGIENCLLEVLQSNQKAIKAYQSVGFEIIKNYKCFSGEIKSEPNHHSLITFQQKEIPDWEKYDRFTTYGHAWGNSKTAIEITEKYDFWEMYANAKLIGYFIVHPVSGTIAQLELENWAKYGALLFQKIASFHAKVKINNLDERDETKIKCLQSIGLQNTVDQYEMKFEL